MENDNPVNDVRMKLTETTRQSEKDIVEILREAGFGVVEGADEVRKKIQEIGNERKLNNRRLQQSRRGVEESKCETSSPSDDK